MANLTFREVEDHANINFKDGESGHPTITNLKRENGFVSLDLHFPIGFVNKSGDRPGDWTFIAHLHELGHALGLPHAGPYNGYPIPTYGLDNRFAADSYQTSVMSYFTQTRNTGIDASKAYPVTPMMADILAIQKLYGVPETNPGDTVYGYQSNVDGYLGEVFAAITEQDGELDGPVALTLFDSGGEDRLDLRTDETDQRVDLRPEGVSDVYGLTGNWLIARGTVIENLVAGQGDDQVIANAAVNELDGGPGSDTVSYVGSDAGVRVDLDAGTGVGGHAQGDALSNFEHVVGSAHADELRGDELANRLAGGAGDDTLYGNAGADTLDGGAGNDQLYGHEGDDHLRGDGGADVLEGGAGADTLEGGSGENSAAYRGSDVGVEVNLDSGVVSGGHAAGDRLISIQHLIGSAYADTLTGDADANRLAGGAGDDRLYGSAGDDVLVGGAGADTLGGGAGADYLDGGGGPDRLAGGAGDDTLEGGLGKDTLDGGAGYDTATYAGSAAGVRIDLKAGTFQGGDAAGDALTDIERIVGSAQGDVLWGSDGTDHLVGGAGDDELDGRPGDDTLAGGAGADTLDGGAGDDTLRGGDGDDVLAGGAGDDKVYGEDGDDLVKGGPGADTLAGAGGDDTLSYGDSDEGVKVDLYSHTASGGHAEGDGIRGFQHLVGSAQADELRGDSGANELWGGAGDDELRGEAGDDTLDGGEGKDQLYGNDGNDRLDGGLNNDRLWGGDGNDRLDGGLNNDKLWGDGGNDRLDGGAGYDRLKGGRGDDTLHGGAGNDQLYGGTGADTASYTDSDAGVHVDLHAGRATGGHAQGDKLTDIENLRGSAHDDGLRGDGGANRLWGGAGDDKLVGWYRHPGGRSRGGHLRIRHGGGLERGQPGPDCRLLREWRGRRHVEHTWQALYR